MDEWMKLFFTYTDKTHDQHSNKGKILYDH